MFDYMRYCRDMHWSRSYFPRKALRNDDSDRLPVDFRSTYDRKTRVKLMRVKKANEELK